MAVCSGGPGNHEHADRNHLFFKVYGERLLTDPIDGAARLSLIDGGFRLDRPHASLNGHAFARTELAVCTHQLDLDPKLGVYPFAEITLPSARYHQLVTVLCATPVGADAPAVEVTSDDDSWTVHVGTLRARIALTDGAPNVIWNG